jgi:SAM-dependent methyltransferase
MCADRPTDAGPDPDHFGPRQLLARHLVGSGVELGPGHVPLEIPFPAVVVRYVDRWEPDQNRSLFPELGGDAPFPEPDIVADFNVERLSALADASQDFVVCSHLLEHLAEPIGFLHEIHRVLRPDGVVLVLLPDRHRTFDRHREPTSLAHLIAEHEAGVTEVDEAHLIDFIVNAQRPRLQWVPGRPAPVQLDALGATDEERAATIDVHRRRSVHVHCWDEEEFFAVLVHGAAVLGEQWELVDGMLTEEGGPDGFEFGYVLRRSAVELDPDTRRERLARTAAVWRAARRATLDASADAATELAALHRRVAELERVRAEQSSQLAEQSGRLVAQAARIELLDRSALNRLHALARRLLARTERR